MGMEEDRLLRVQLRESRWALTLDGITRELRVLTPPGDAGDSFRHWNLVEGRGGFVSGPDALLWDGSRCLVVVEAKRERRAARNAARRTAAFEAWGYAIQLRRAVTVTGQVYTRAGKAPHRLTSLLNVETTANIIVVAALVGLRDDPPEEVDLDLSSLRRELARTPAGWRSGPPKASSWQARLDWSGGSASFPWVSADRVGPVARQVTLSDRP